MRKQLIGKIFVATLLASAIAGCSKPLSHDELLVRAGQAYQSGELNAAMIDVRTALQEQPDSASARRLHGEILLAQRAMSDAVSNFERSLQAEESAAVAALYGKALNESAQSRQFREMHEQGRFSYATDEPAYIAQVVIAGVNTRNADEAQEVLFNALEKHPDHPQLELAHAYLLIQHNRAANEAVAILQRLTEQDETFEDAWSQLGLALRLSGDQEGARAAYAKAAELNPFRFEDRIAHIMLLIDNSDYSEADQLLTELDNVDHPSVHFARARLLLADNEARPALQKLQQVLAAQPDHIGALYLSGVANARSGNFSTAEAQLRRFLAFVPGHTEASINLAQIYLSLEEPARAETLMRGVIRNHPDNARAVNILGVAMAAQGYNSETGLFDELVKGAPDSPLMRLQLGTQLLRSGDLKRGIDELESARDLDPNDPTIRANLVLAHLLADDEPAAQAEIDSYMEVAADQPDPHILAARLSLHQGDFAAAEQHYERALDIHPENLDSRDGLALVAMRGGDLDRALDLLGDAEDLDGRLKLALVHEQRDDEAALLKTLKEAAVAYPEDIDPHLTEARYYFRKAEYQKAADKAASLQQDFPDEPQVYQLLTGASLSTGQTEQALEAANHLLELVPDNARALRLAAQAELVNNNVAMAEQHLTKILENQPEDLETRKLLVEVLLQQGKLREMNEQLGLLPEGFLPEAQLLTARGRLALEAGDLDEAEQLLQTAFEREPNSASLIFLTHALALKDQIPQAIDLLANWVADHPQDGQALHQLGTLYIANGQDDRAAEVYEQLITLAAEDVIALNNLAWSYRHANQDRALALAEKAAELAPEHAAVKDTHSMVLYHRGEFGRALTSNQTALELAPQNPQLLYHRAMILVAAGSDQEAVTILEELAGSQAQFPAKGEALQLLEQLKGS